MSPRLTNKDDENPSVLIKLFRGVNGNRIILEEAQSITNNKDNRVVQFEVKNGENKINIKVDAALILFIFLIWIFTSHQLITIVIGALCALIRIRGIVLTVDTDTLLVVESVGVQIIGKRLLSCFESSTFLPWNTINDVFINEVITGHRVLYFLTFIIKDSYGGEESTRLVPLFRDLIPERKCLEYINSKEFIYDRELMKIVRRIIKIKPRQGQQFCTRHLLVTYNHSSWTRQDKMFAMLKFSDRRDATAYPHAIVLTIKIISPDIEGNYSDFGNLRKWECLDSPRKNGTRLSSTNEESIASSPRPSADLQNSTDDNNRSFFGDFALPNVEDNLRNEINPTNSSLPDNSSANDPMNDIQETADMPYQYLIEREIEKTKAKNESNAKIQMDKVRDKKIETPIIKSNALSTSENSSRSSNITDLVMEGLMFTIRQDKDTVTVVEQKTKLEPDEVLENSEKIETTEGAECLVNSSLLKLENLITKIEMSGGCDKKKLPAPLFSLNSSFNNFNNHLIQEKTNDKLRDTFEDEKNIDGSEEDILPDALREKSLNIEVKEADIPELNNEKSKLKIPRIVSSEVVKYDLSLLRSGKSKRTLCYEDNSNSNDCSEDAKEENDDDNTVVNGDEDDEIRGRKILVGKRRILPNEDNDIRIDMLKFVKDMTLGVRVVVQRLDVANMSTALRKNSHSNREKKIY